MEEETDEELDEESDETETDDSDEESHETETGGFRGKYGGLVQWKRFLAQNMITIFVRIATSRAIYEYP